MTRIIFILFLLVILFIFNYWGFIENFNIKQESNNMGNTGIYNYFYDQVLNPYEYPMTPFFSNDAQIMPKPSPEHPKY